MCRWPTTWSCCGTPASRPCPARRPRSSTTRSGPVLCPDKINTEEWLFAHRTAHGVGLRSNVTIMFGAVEQPRSWARHLVRTRDLQKETGGFTEFVPLPFVHMATPLYLQRRSRRGPTFRETLLMHAVGRIAYRGAIDNIQISWVKMGADGVRQILRAGVNDLGWHPHGREHLAGGRGQPRPDDGRRAVPRHRRARWAGPWPSAPPCTAGSPARADAGAGRGRLIDRLMTPAGRPAVEPASDRPTSSTDAGRPAGARRHASAAQRRLYRSMLDTVAAAGRRRAPR